MTSYQSIFRPDLFAGQVYLVTGGGTGIGRTIAHELASLGAHVVVSARKEERLNAVVEEIQNAGGKASFATVNIRDEESITALFDKVLDEHGTLHGLVNNAGGQFPSPAQFISKKGWHAVVETNLTGTFLVSKEAYNRVFGEKGGAIVNIVAEMWRGFPGMAHTGAARAGVVNLTKTLAVEWAHAGVRVNSVAPGTIEGHGLTQYDEGIQEMLSQIKNDVPMKRLGTESEVSAAVTYLLSPAAAYVTGETLRVDGASSLWIKTWQIPDHEQFVPFHGWTDNATEPSE
ncbi:MAG: SDR family oxidoreductase [Deltaproteobacteria bacterium]|nr:MAG: SDR family oxidoreductase [Deltaproteobacteria bacterium]